MLWNVLEDFEHLSEDSAFDCAGFNRDYGLWAQGLMYDRNQKGLDPLKDERLTLLNETLQVKERDQECTQERLREMEERIMESQK